MKPQVFNYRQYTDLEADYMILKAENEQLKARLAVAALREKQERDKGCEYCNTKHEDWSTGGAHDFRIHEGAIYYYDRMFGWEGMTINLCPMCGRSLKEEHNDKT